MMQKDCLAHAAATIDQDQLRRPRFASAEDVVEELKFLLAVDKHGFLFYRFDLSV